MDDPLFDNDERFVLVAAAAAVTKLRTNVFNGVKNSAIVGGTGFYVSAR